MQIDERNYLSQLFDTYGKLLSSKQFEVMDTFLNYDLGESEIAESTNGSRQSVHDAFNKAKNQLFEFEKKCGFLNEQEVQKNKLIEAKSLLKNGKTDAAVKILDEII
ncbi:MAG: DNA-binding protein [Clostridia bacterium]|nr:DNA-binding protein [Clostridia bacterium]